MKYYLSALLVLSLVACSRDANVSRTLGFSKDAPDEFMVISHAPLTVPPEFTLVPPEKNQARGGRQSSEEAKQLLFHERERGGGLADTSGERSLLQKAGTEGRGDIREILTAEEELGKDKTFLQRVTTPLKGEKKQPIVDVDKEEARLAKNREEGKPVNAGDVPTTKPESPGLVNQIFN